MYCIFKRKKVLSFLILIVLIMNATTLQLVSAETANPMTLKIIQKNEQTIELTDGVAKESIIVNNINNDLTKINVVAANESSYFIVDKSQGTIYSSLANETFNISDFLENETTGKYARAAKNTTTKKISFAKIKKGLGGTATVATIAGIVLSILSGLGYALPAMLAVLTDKIGQIATVASLVVKGSSKHGIAIKMKSYIRSTTKNGKVYKYKAWKVTNVSRY